MLILTVDAHWTSQHAAKYSCTGRYSNRHCGEFSYNHLYQQSNQYVSCTQLLSAFWVTITAFLGPDAEIGMWAGSVSNILFSLLVWLRSRAANCATHPDKKNHIMHPCTVPWAAQPSVEWAWRLQINYAADSQGLQPFQTRRCRVAEVMLRLSRPRQPMLQQAFFSLEIHLSRFIWPLLNNCKPTFRKALWWQGNGHVLQECSAAWTNVVVVVMSTITVLC
jgi:hypothetical protein